jgi:hypothetical protein
MNNYKKIIVLLALVLTLSYGLQLSTYGLAWHGGPGGECVP